MSPEQAKIALSERQRTNTLEKTIELYGEEQGKLIYQSRCDFVGYRNILDYYKETFGEKEGTKKYLKLQKLKRLNKSSYEAFNFFVPIYKFLRNNGFTIQDIKWSAGS